MKFSVTGTSVASVGGKASPMSFVCPWIKGSRQNIKGLHAIVPRTARSPAA
jgi:hypothetical protein